MFACKSRFVAADCGTPGTIMQRGQAIEPQPQPQPLFRSRWEAVDAKAGRRREALFLPGCPRGESCLLRLRLRRAAYLTDASCQTPWPAKRQQQQQTLASQPMLELNFIHKTSGYQRPRRDEISGFRFVFVRRFNGRRT